MFNPIPAQAVDRPSDVKRRVLCSHYSECLEICVSNRWQSFSCSECRDFNFECPNDTAHWAQQNDNSKLLLINAGYMPKWIADRIGNQYDYDDFCYSFRKKPLAFPRGARVANH
jgi:hypothetical protein